MYLLSDGVLPLYGVSLGRYQGLSSVNKFGRAPAGVQTSPTDIWSLADALVTQQIWLAPTAARTHQITSTDAGDTLLGAGARKVRIWGLTSWDTPEEYEDVEMAGLANVPTAKQWVIIHRMKCIDYGALGPNIGRISATADVDGTITAVILGGSVEGQTEMAIYGVPSCGTFLMAGLYATMIASASGTVRVDYDILCAELPETQPAVFINKGHQAIFGAGTSAMPYQFAVPKPFPGPCIIKIQAKSTLNDVGLSAGFDGILVETG